MRLPVRPFGTGLQLGRRFEAAIRETLQGVFVGYRLNSYRETPTNGENFRSFRVPLPAPQHTLVHPADAPRCATLRTRPDYTEAMRITASLTAVVMHVRALFRSRLSKAASHAIQIVRHRYTSRGKDLDYWVGVPVCSTAEHLPIAIFIEGDGSHCQRFREHLWKRFLRKHTRDFLLVRPRTFVNEYCGKARFVHADFSHRVDELATLVDAVIQSYPGRRIYLIGESAGAHIAICFSRRSDVVAGIVNLGGGVDELAKVLPEIERERRRHGILDEAALVKRLQTVDEILASVRTAPHRTARFWGRTHLFWYQMLFLDVREHWRAATLPVLIVHGERDHDNVPISIVRRAKIDFESAGKSNVRFVLYPELGHDLRISRVLDDINAWIGEQERARA